MNGTCKVEWQTPRRNQGQIVTVSYGFSNIGSDDRVYMRRVDSGDGRVEHFAARITDGMDLDFDEYAPPIKRAEWVALTVAEAKRLGLV